MKDGGAATETAKDLGIKLTTPKPWLGTWKRAGLRVVAGEEAANEAVHQQARAAARASASRHGRVPSYVDIGRLRVQTDDDLGALLCGHGCDICCTQSCCWWRRATS